MDMKKIIWKTILILLVLILGSVTAVQAEVIPPYGEGQIGLQAVVLCERLTVRQEPRADSTAVKTLQYGDLVIIQKQMDGWAECFLSDAEDAGPAGWINSDYIAVDPAWYQTDTATYVYAWNDISAPKVALLDKDITLPVLKTDGAWLIVSLRGAVGWIYNGASD